MTGEQNSPIPPEFRIHFHTFQGTSRELHDIRRDPSIELQVRRSAARRPLAWAFVVGLSIAHREGLTTDIASVGTQDAISYLGEIELKEALAGLLVFSTCPMWEEHDPF